jgi:hypothetical protein
MFASLLGKHAHLTEKVIMILALEEREAVRREPRSLCPCSLAPEPGACSRRGRRRSPRRRRAHRSGRRKSADPGGPGPPLAPDVITVATRGLRAFTGGAR